LRGAEYLRLRSPLRPICDRNLRQIGGRQALYSLPFRLCGDAGADPFSTYFPLYDRPYRELEIIGGGAQVASAYPRVEARMNDDAQVASPADRK